MPRPNKDRQVEHEANLARRIEVERERRDWSLTDLARRMTDAGCPLHASAIHKIEKGDPPRRISLNEAVAFAQVFGLPLGALILGPGVVATKEALAMWTKYEAATERYLAARQELEDVERRLVSLTDGIEGDLVLGALVEKHGEHAEAIVSNAKFFRDNPPPRAGDS